MEVCSSLFRSAGALGLCNQCFRAAQGLPWPGNHCIPPQALKVIVFCCRADDAPNSVNNDHERCTPNKELRFCLGERANAMARRSIFRIYSIEFGTASPQIYSPKMATINSGEKWPPFSPALTTPSRLPYSCLWQWKSTELPCSKCWNFQQIVVKQGG